MSLLEAAFPELAATGYRLTSPTDPNYNCLAWALGESDRWWWPDGFDVGHWPSGVAREESLEAFTEAFATLGYLVTSDRDPVPGIARVAVYAKAGVPTHVCRQLANGRWTSKLGYSEDIEHALEGLCGAVYGTVALVFERIG